MLSQDCFDAARRFVLDHARPVDRAIFLHLFEGADVGELQEALSAFRNPDGGFGHGMEPDFRLPDSSVTATTVALQYLRDSRATSEDELVVGAIRYLVDRFDPALGGWARVPDSVTDHPHAPWWAPNPQGASASLHLDAEVVGYLNEYRELVAPAFLAERSDAIRATVKTRAVDMGSYTALGLLRLAAFAPSPLRTEIFDALCEEVPATIDPDPEKWGGDFQPFWLLVEGGSTLTEKLASVISLSLDREVARQAEDGSWPPRWSWSDYPEEWKVASHEWAGEQTVRTLRALRRADRLPSG